MLDQLRELAPIRALRRYRFDRRFVRHGDGFCRGVFESFAAAVATAPAARPVGYDHGDAAGMYRDRMSRVYAMDYPVLFWLTRLYPTGMSRLFDYGGHVGVCHYAWRRHLESCPIARWTVLDLPTVVQEGAALARTRGERSLEFTSEFATASGADVLLANGSLQYVEDSFARLVSTLASPPRHVIVNKLPTHAGRAFVTLQHIGVAYCPYRIHQVEDVPRSMAAIGYREVDRWENPDLSCRLPFHPEAHPITYRGYCFELAS